MYRIIYFYINIFFHKTQTVIIYIIGIIPYNRTWIYRERKNIKILRALLRNLLKSNVILKLQETNISSSLKIQHKTGFIKSIIQSMIEKVVFVNDFNQKGSKNILTANLKIPNPLYQFPSYSFLRLYLLSKFFTVYLSNPHALPT